MNGIKQGMSKKDLNGFNGLNNTSMTLPPVYTNRVATIAANPFEHMYAELADIKMMLSLILQQKNVVEEKSDLVGLNEACKLIGISPSTMYKLTADKKIPFIKRPGSSKLIFSRTDLGTWVKESDVSKVNLVEEHIHRKLRVRKVQNN